MSTLLSRTWESIKTPQAVPVVLLAALVLIAPLGLSGYGLYLMSLVGVYAIGSLGLIILTGHGGLLNLGYSGFLALGAYTGAHIVNDGGSPVVALVVGALAGALAGAMVGIFALWMSEFAIAIVTFGVGTFVALAVRELEDFTGGLSGLAIMQIDPTANFYLVWGVLAAAAAIAAVVLRGWFGRSLRAIRDDLEAAAMFGLAPRRARFVAFVVTAPFATVAGVLYGQTLGFVSPEGFNIFMALGFVVIVILGGVTSLWGALIGSFLWVMVPEWTAGVTGLYNILFGALALLVIRFAPDGIAGLIGRFATAAIHTAQGARNSGHAATPVASSNDPDGRNNK